MAKRNVYAVKDIKAGYLQPMLDANDETAKRGFAFALTKPGTLEFSNIQDYQLFCIGTFDDDTGIIEAIDHRLVLDGASLLKGDNNVQN